LAFRSRFCCALAPCDIEMSRDKLVVSGRLRFP
jgi:hypothetical protein